MIGTRRNKRVITQPIYPLILAGGYGTRLWPLSREQFPKQFQTLIGEKSLLQTTLKRLDSLAHHTPALICNYEHRFLVAEQLHKIQLKADILLEPVSRNTAPAIALGALHTLERDPNAVLLVMPADHFIADHNQFAQAVNRAATYAQQGHIAIFGIQPTRAETGYGYIEVNKSQAKENQSVYSLIHFVEKPDLKKAEAYLASGNYLWNSGIYCLRADTYLNALRHYQPLILNAASQAYQNACHDDDFIRIPEGIFAKTPDISIDYAIMENINADPAITTQVITIEGWSDMGSWGAIWEVSEKDSHQNVTEGDVVMLASSENYVRAEHRLVATIGIHHCIVIETNDAVLIADKSQLDQVKQIIKQLKTSDRHEHAQHLRVRRPWGSYECIDKGKRYQVKRIVVNPGGALSLQMHHHRSEHWVIVKGVARITCHDKVMLLHENQSTYIPPCTAHRLENPGIVPLELIEVQSGSYLGEDDIIRLHDNYGRADEIRPLA